MIIKMAKIEIVGPKDLLMETLDLLRSEGVFQPEADIRGFVSHEDEVRLNELLLDEKAIGEKTYFLSLQERIRKLLACLPDQTTRATYLQPLPVIDILHELVAKHLASCQGWQQQMTSLREDLEALSQQLVFWKALEPLVAEVAKDTTLAFFGVTLRDPRQIPDLQRLLETQTDGRCRLSVAETEDGQAVALITTDQGMADRLRDVLASKQVPELALPDELAGLPFTEKCAALQRRQTAIKEKLGQLLHQMETFAHHWLPIYRQAFDWLEERLALYQSTAMAFETRQCFLIHGWMAAALVEGLQNCLTERFRGQVVLSVLQMHQEDYDRVPVLLENPLYFKPFEVFARLLPLPKYSSYDPTPFLGLFFPLLFGMILGDIGYGLLLGLLAWGLIHYFPQRSLLVDGAKILGVSAAYTLFFGLLFGDFFGDLGAHWLGLHPLWLERSQAIVPMIVFAVAVGAMHILLGLGLGIGYDVKRRHAREAIVKLLTLLLILLCGTWLAGVLLPNGGDLGLPLLLSILLLLPVLTIAGGLLAPLELLKSFGNIISYVRIMAIGLSSVLLAQVANRLGGMTGDILSGFLVAGLLHFFNLLLGVFAPTVHSLRLHYVEFFGKFLEFGGREFRPLQKKKT